MRGTPARKGVPLNPAHLKALLSGLEPSHFIFELDLDEADAARVHRRDAHVESPTGFQMGGRVEIDDFEVMFRWVDSPVL